MKQKIIIYTIVALLIVTPQLSFAQYFQGLYDVDTSQDWGSDLFIQPDGNYFVRATSISTAIYNWSLVNMQISADGSTVLSKHILRFDSLNLFLGYPGETKLLQGDGYISPITIQNLHPL